jgi:hypothetical protein
MSKRAYEMIGFVVWQIAVRSVRRSLVENRAKIGAGAAVALVLIGGAAAARAGGDED